jgi:hypothetical protein
MTWPGDGQRPMRNGSWRKKEMKLMNQFPKKRLKELTRAGQVSEGRIAMVLFMVSGSRPTGLPQCL